MRKLSFLLGTLGGALAGYLLSNPKLRDELTKAKDAETAARRLGEYLQRDGKKIAKEVKNFIESDDVQRNLGKAKKFAQQKLHAAKKEVEKFVRNEGKFVVRTVRSKRKMRR